MNEKKVSLGTVICLIIIFILIMCLAGMWYYYNHIKVVDNGIKNNETELNNNDSNDENIIPKDEEKEECNKVHEELDEDLARFITENYLNLQGKKEGDYQNFLQSLNLVDEVKMNSEEITEDSDGNKLWKTNIKYIDYKEKLLKYMSLNCFEKFSSIGFAEKDGYLYTIPGGGSGGSFDIYDAKLKEQTDKYFVYELKAKTYNPGNELEYYNIESVIVEENGRYVLDSYKYIQSN